MTTAVDAVLQTAELLEQILFELPTKDLFWAATVNKTWQQAIADSSKLQKALFRKPIVAAENLKFSPEYNSPPDDAQAGGFLSCYANALLKAPFFLPSKFFQTAMGQEEGPAWSLPESSMRQMMFSQPAAIRVTLHVSRCSKGKWIDMVTILRVCNAEGVRAGHVVDRIMKHQKMSTDGMEDLLVKVVIMPMGDSQMLGSNWELLALAG